MTRGVAITPYRVNLEQLEAAFGGLPPDRRAELRAACREQLEELAFGFDGVSLVDAQACFLDGRADGPTAGAAYWFAIEALVGQLGGSLSGSAWQTVEQNYFGAVPEVELFGLTFAQVIARPQYDPYVYIVRSAHLQAACDHLALTACTPAQRAQFEGWCAEAREAGQGLFLMGLWVEWCDDDDYA